MAVAEACSGLRMLTAFVIVAAFVAYMVKRPRWQKAALLLSSIPIAVACNILRLCVTAALFMLVSAEVGQKFFHDFAGVAMMPAAALLLFAELWLMNMLIVPEIQPQRTQQFRPQSTQRTQRKTMKANYAPAVPRAED
jgi:exosortase/archaeosortase family protein